MPNLIADRMARELESIRDRGELRTLDHVCGIDLSSNDYLGLAADPRLKKATLDAVTKAGRIGSTGSRLLSGNAREWEQLESEFANFACTEASLYFGSGYAANVGVLGAILKPEDVVFSDELNHASLIDGIRLSRATKVIYPHNDMQFLEHTLREHALGEQTKHESTKAADPQVRPAKLIVTETLFSMEGDLAPVASLLRLAREYGAELIVDEAHATGVLGPNGRGLAAELGVTRDILAAVHTCGKALASAGAFVCCSETTKQYVVNRARTFIFSTAMPPHLAGQIRAAIEIAIDAGQERAHLRDTAALLREELAAAGIEFGASASQIVPIFCGANEMALGLAAALQAAGFAAKAIRPPTVPSGSARVRVSLTAKITREDVFRLAAAVRDAFASLRSSPSSAVVHA